MPLFTRKRDRPTPPAERLPARGGGHVASLAPVRLAATRHDGVLIAPHLTEKTNAAAGLRWYAFRVSRGASKISIKQAVEERYGVSVERVRTAAPRSKSVRIGRSAGRTPGFKKAIVRLSPGQTIDLT